MDHVVAVPATSANLGAGFDTLGVALARYLRVATGRREGPRVVTRGADADQLAGGDDNLVWTSFVHGCDVFGHPVPDLRLDVDNDIPLERGLGSSSSAIVAGLALARVVSTAELDDRELVRIATELEGHPDNVAPAILGGLVTTATGDDGRLVVRRADPAASLAMVVAVPAQRSRTDETRATLPDGLGRSDLVDQLGRLAHVVGGLLGAWPLEAILAGDRFHESARLTGQPATAALLAGWRAEGIFAVLSGAGPTVVSIVGASANEIASAVATGRQVAADAGVALDVAHVPWDRTGARSWPRRTRDHTS